MPGPNPTNNYVGSFNFLVTVEGFSTAMDGFSSCSGIKAVTEVYDFKHGFDTHIRKHIGRNHYEPITLERVYSGLDEFAAWRDQIEAGNLLRKRVTIDYLTANQKLVSRFTLLGAFPARWETPDLDAMGSNPGIERIELEFERVIREASGDHLTPGTGGEGWWSAPFRDSVTPTEPAPDWVHGNGVSNGDPARKQRQLDYPDWVFGNVDLGKSRQMEYPDWVKGNVDLGKSRQMAYPDWVKGNPGKAYPRRTLDYPDWVFSYGGQKKGNKKG